MAGGGPSVEEYRLYTSRVRRFLLLGGVSPRTTASWPACVVAGSCFLMSCAVLNYCLSNVANLNALTRGTGIACSLMATALKAICFLTNRDQLAELDETLERLFEEELALPGESRFAALSSLHTFDRPAYIFSFLVGGATFMYIVPPLVTIVGQMASDREPTRFPLPFPARFPWPIDNGGPRYRVHFLYEGMIGWFLIFTNSGVDALFGFHVYRMSALLRAMACRLTNDGRAGGSGELLRECIGKHQQLLHCRDILQTVYGPIVIWLVLVNSMVMCTLVFQACQITDITIGKLILFAFFMFLKVVQTFTYAWYGTLVKFESEAFRQGVYLSDWIQNNDRSLKKNVLVTMIQRPMTVTASHFFFVSIDMFIKIMNTTISYFFLLQTLDEKR